MSTTANASPKSCIELLAPAGDWECVDAAVENGADAIYFGLDCGFNARHRAQNFGVPDLIPLMEHLRRRGVRGYVTLNTLAFPTELEPISLVIAAVAEAGVDAVLVQDFGVAQLVQTICPDLEIHASTQMSLTSAETIRVAAALGLSRVVLARELSIREIREIASQSDMPLEVFIHGALCVAYSGQCLTSESLGGRSANRGQCAQACRLPYELICDGQPRDLGDVRYLLSPQDLAGYAAIPDLIEAGVASIKIEGRLKSPEYVANITHHYRRAIEQAYEQGVVSVSDHDRREMELSFSRGFSPGWLEGNDHKRLVPGLQSDKRGIRLGEITAIGKDRIRLRLAASVALGDGLAMHLSGVGSESDEDRVQGGRVYSLEDNHGRNCRELAEGHLAWIGFGRGEIDWQHVDVESMVFKNDDPQLNRRLRNSYRRRDPQTRQPLDLFVVASSGSPLRVVARTASGLELERCSAEPLEVARNRPVDAAILREKLGRLGGTPFELGNFDAVIKDAPMVPMPLMNHIRRELVAELLQRLEQPPARTIHLDAARTLLSSPNRCQNPTETNAEQRAKPGLTVLCRNLEQLETLARDVGPIELVYADFHDIRQYRDVVKLANDHQLPIGLATVRMQKPGEMGLLRAIGKRQPDWILARNLAAIEHFRDGGLPMVADFSLNVANRLSASWILSLGASRITASYDLNRDQLLDLAQSVNASELEVVIHQQMPMFHMEHCVFCSVLSPGTNKTNCGRPCDRHVVKLRDRVGAEHTLEADVACRNTLYNATPQSGAEVVTPLMDCGVGCFRIELLDQNAEQTRSIVAMYRDLVEGKIDGTQVWRTLQAANRLGVTRGTMESKRDPLAIL